MKTLGVALFASVLGGGILIAKSSDATLKKGDKAPAFSASGTDMKSHTLASITKDGPAFLYFIKEGCPVNHRAAPHMTKMFDAYKTKGNLVGVYDGSVAEAKSWAKTYGAKYLIVSDPDLKLIREYGVPYSPFLIEVGKDGKVTEVLEGLSAKELGMVNVNYSKAIKAGMVSMDYKGAPSGGG
jgi:peroxiredoxin